MVHWDVCLKTLGHRVYVMNGIFQWYININVAFCNKKNQVSFNFWHQLPSIITQQCVNITGSFAFAVCKCSCYPAAVIIQFTYKMLCILPWKTPEDSGRWSQFGSSYLFFIKCNISLWCFSSSISSRVSWACQTHISPSNQIRNISHNTNKRFFVLLLLT